MVGYVTVFDIQSSLLRQLGVRLHESHFFMDGPIADFGMFLVGRGGRGGGIATRGGGGCPTDGGRRKFDGTSLPRQ